MQEIVYFPVQSTFCTFRTNPRKIIKLFSQQEMLQESSKCRHSLAQHENEIRFDIDLQWRTDKTQNLLQKNLPNVPIQLYLYLAIRQLTLSSYVPFLYLLYVFHLFFNLKIYLGRGVFALRKPLWLVGLQRRLSNSKSDKLFVTLLLKKQTNRNPQVSTFSRIPKDLF